MFVFKAGVVGAGVMGGEIAQVIAAAGVPVVLKDVDAKFVDAGLEKAREVTQGQVAKLVNVEVTGVDRASKLDDRFGAAFKAVLTRWPQAFAGSDLDPDANRKRMESLVQRMEDLAKSLGGPASAAGPDAALSPTNRLAAMLKEALAANTIGGKVDDDARLRAAAEDVRQAQASWSRIGFVPEEARRSLADRFTRAIRAVSERATQAARPGGSGRSGESSRPGGPGR